MNGASFAFHLELLEPRVFFKCARLPTPLDAGASLERRENQRVEPHTERESGQKKQAVIFSAANRSGRFSKRHSAAFFRVRFSLSKVFLLFYFFHGSTFVLLNELCFPCLGCFLFNFFSFNILQDFAGLHFKALSRHAHWFRETDCILMNALKSLNNCATFAPSRRF